MNPIFADAGYWIAVVDEDDQLHERARRIAASLGPRQIVTTEMALVEFLNHMSKLGRYKRKLAFDAVAGFRANPNIEVISQTPQQFQAAYALYGARLDQRWGATDCASFLVMDQRNITEALAYDADFVQAGFAALLRQDG